MFRKLLAFMVFTTTYAGYMIPIKTTVKNNSAQKVNIFCQASGPFVDRYSGEQGWCYDKWPVLNLAPGEERVVDFWIFTEEQSKLKLSILFSDNGDMVSGDEAIINYFRTDANLYVGDTTFYSLGNNDLKVSHSGNLECNLKGSGGNYSAQLEVF